MIKDYISKHRYILTLSTLILGYCIIFIYICIWKYYNFQYNELDLAIFNQTFFNSVNGNLFANSIQGQNYLGDHFAPFIFLILPFYYIFQHPIFLLTIQVLVIAISAIPLYFIAKKILHREFFALIFVGLFLLNFSVQSMNLFGFHLLPFFILIFFLLYYAYLQKQFYLYSALIVLALILREDTALVIVPFSIIPFLDWYSIRSQHGIKNSCKWWIIPLFGLVYFFIAFKAIAFFNDDSSYKFLVYYGWMGNSWLEIITTTIFHPFKILAHLFRIGSAELIIGLTMPLFFISFKAIKYLLPIIPLLLLTLLQTAGTESLVIQTHYSALLIPFIFISAIYGFKSIKDNSFFSKNVWLVILIVSSLYTSYFLGPFPEIFNEIKLNSLMQTEQSKNEFIQQIPEDAKIVSTTSFINHFSTRSDIYSLHYLLSENRQFSDIAYFVSSDLDYLIIDSNEFIYYYYQNLNKQFSNVSYDDVFDEIDNRFLDFLGKQNMTLLDISGTNLLFSNHGKNIKLYKELGLATKQFNSSNRINIKKAKAIKNIKNELLTYDISLQLSLSKLLENQEDHYQLKFIWEDELTSNKQIQYYPIAYGLYPVNEWPVDKVIETIYNVIAPKGFVGSYVKVEIVKTIGVAALNNIGTIQNIIQSEEVLNEFTIELN